MVCIFRQLETVSGISSLTWRNQHFDIWIKCGWIATVTEMATEKTEDTEPQNPAVDAAYIAGQVYAGCGDETDPRNMLALMTMIEAFINGGEDFANAKMGWTVQTIPATVTTLEIVRQKPTPFKPRPKDK